MKMILQKKIQIQRTPLDIPLMLFLASQIVSTVFSLDPHVSIWGFYSRFNGGLLSIIAYISLYYAIVTNLDVKQILKVLYVGLFSGIIVALWGIPSHFGLDPTCYIFRGTFDTSCWTEAFKPTVRIFSTLGQPAWLAAYMSVLIPLSISYFLIFRRAKESISHNKPLTYGIFIVVILFYAALTYTDTRGGFIGFWIANIVMWGVLYIKKFFLPRLFIKYFLTFNLLFLIFNFLQGMPIGQLSKFTIPELTKKSQTTVEAKAEAAPQQAGELGGTDSGKIRLLVWRGAIDAWKDNPIIGTGVETFAFAYYKHKPVEHNMTSEWDYLYNKAHNEYLNYLTTTGIFGLGSYLAIIGTFLFYTYKQLLNGYIAKLLVKNKKSNSTIQQFNNHQNLDQSRNMLLIVGLFCGWISILISNFFGFSVVITNLYLFLIPAFVFVLGGLLSPKKILIFPNEELRIKNHESRTNMNITKKQFVLFVILILTSCFLLLSLHSYWDADKSYALGSNLNKAGNYQESLTPLQNAAIAKPNEPVYTDELSLNIGTLASGFFLSKDASTGAQLAKDAVILNTNVVNTHPNNVVYWKNRVRLFYTLAQGDPENKEKYLKDALASIEKASVLAPTDAKISYNLGIMLGQTGDVERAIEVLQETVRLKPDYRDPYFALGLFYNQLATDENGVVTDPTLQQKAIDSYQYILKNIDPADKQVIDALQEWGQ